MLRHALVGVDMVVVDAAELESVDGTAVANTAKNDQADQGNKRRHLGRTGQGRTVGQLTQKEEGERG